MTLATAIPDGVYRIITARDAGVCFDCYDGGSANGTNVQLWCENDGTTNNQVFKVVNTSDGFIKIANVNSGNVIDIYNDAGGVPQAGSNLQLWADNGGATGNQKWLLIDSGRTVARNGETRRLFLLRSAGNSALYADAYGGSSSMGTNMQVWKRNDGSTLNQCFDFKKESMFAASMPVPSALAVRLSATGQDLTTIGASGPVRFFAAFRGAAGQYQVRYRWRTRTASQDADEREAWSRWRALGTDAVSDEGWGDAWATAVATTTAGGKIVATKYIGADLSGGYDLMEVEIEARRFSASYGPQQVPAHGGSASRRVTVARSASPSVDGAVAWTPHGLMVPLKSGLARGGNLVRCRVRGYTDWRTESGQGAACTVLFSGSQLKRIPADGADLAVDVEWQTADGIKSSRVAMPAKCSWQADHSISFDAQVTVGTGRTLSFYVGDHATERLWIVHPGGVQEIEGDGKGSFKDVPYPFGVPFSVYAMVMDTDTKWGTWSKSYPAQPFSGFLFNFPPTQGQTWAQILHGAGDAPKLSRSVSPDADSLKLSGGGHDVVRFGGAVSEGLKLTGALVWPLGDSPERFDALARCGWAWLRDGDGHLWRVAVTGASVDRLMGHGAEVSLDMVVVDHG